jgi:hypothetical protein
MRACRGMGAVNPAKMPEAKRRKPAGYAEGGAGKRAGKQFVAQPKKIAQKTARYR